VSFTCALALVAAPAAEPMSRSVAGPLAVPDAPASLAAPDPPAPPRPAAAVAAPVVARTDASAPPPAAPARPRWPAGLAVFPYGWVRADATYHQARDEGFSNVRLGGARLGGGVAVGPVLAFATLEAAAEKGPQLFDAFVAWTIVERLRVRAGQFKAPFGYRFNVPDLVDELPMAPVSLQAATPGRQAGGEISYDFWRFAQLSAGAFSGVGQNRAANNTRVAFAGKLQVQPLVSSRRLPQIVANLSIFTYHKTHGFTPDVHTPLGLVFYHGVPANGGSYRLTAGGGVFWRFLSVRAEYFRTRDARERDDDGDPTTPGVHLPPMIGQGMYVQAGVVVTGQRKRIDDLLPEVEGYRVRASAVELSARYEQFRLGAADLPGNGIRALVGGINWIVAKHLRVYAAGVYQRLDAAPPEIPAARSWGVTGGLAGFFLGRAGGTD